MRATLVSALLMLVTTSFTTHNGPTVTAFQGASEAERKARLDRLLGSDAQPTTAAELSVLLTEGIRDRSPAVRQSALSAVAARVAVPRFSQDPALLARWKDEMPLLAAFRPLIEARLGDADPSVREAAVMAVGNLDVVSTAPPDGPYADGVLSERTVTLLVRRLAAEAEESIRATIIQAFALSGNRSDLISRALVLSTNDRSAGVRRFALRGLEKVPPSVATGLLERGLRDEDRSVRLTSAQMIGRLGHPAGGLRVLVEEVAKHEKDEAVKAEMLRTVQTLRALAPQDR